MRERAERPAGLDLAEAVAQLAWLAPDAASLAALSRPVSPATWASIRHDPGAVLLVLRHVPEAPSASFAALSDPAILTTAAALLEAPGPGFVDWSAPGARRVYRTGLAAARAARRLVEQTGLGDPERAWVCGLLAPLGHMAVCAVAPAAAGGQGIDTADLARRLARRWGLPDWLYGALGHLHLPLPLAEALGADPLYYRLTHLALERARRQGFDLDLACADKAAEAAGALNVTDADEAAAALDASAVWRDPAREPLLRDLLAAAAENRRLRGAALHRRLEQDNATLHRALEGQACGEAGRLQTAKLAALAEFAAGAGHEINNPLAVISGQAQYLLSHGEEWFAEEPDGTSRKALQVILAQTRRIHGMLRDLMQFARPAPPRRVTFDLGALLGEVVAAQREQAETRRVRLDVLPPAGPVPVHADPEQLRLAVGCLVRNAIEAAPAGGWARVRLAEPDDAALVAVVVEDSGPGPDAAQCPYLFDPFYSGRSAGRGRGLGLPIAWRLVQLQGGALRLEPARPGAPTRAIVHLPRAAQPGLTAPPAGAGYRSCA